ncbi:MAG: hypothetical protein IT326_00260 [Anaerolineae bacterium]|nr:hypothetical protein [Anaerolineae bacterium]
MCSSILPLSAGGLDQHLGYEFLVSDAPWHAASLQMDIYMRAKPSHEHFDPQVVHLHVRGDRGELDQLSVVHPWHGQSHFRVCAGRVMLTDSRDKDVIVFTFGGGLQIESTSDYTHLRLSSPVPILDLNAQPGDIQSLLVTSTESLLAHLRAKWGSDPATFAEHVLTVTPEVFFAMCLRRIIDMAEEGHIFSGKDATRRLVASARQYLEQGQHAGIIPASVPDLDEVV